MHRKHFNTDDHKHSNTDDHMIAIDLHDESFEAAASHYNHVVMLLLLILCVISMIWIIPTLLLYFDFQGCTALPP